MTVRLTAQEVLALRHIHSHWANSAGNAPFCDAMSDSFLEKLGGYLNSDRPLWEHPVAKKWYDKHDSCHCCGKYVLNKDLDTVTEDEGLYCKECIEDIKREAQ